MLDSLTKKMDFSKKKKKISKRMEHNYTAMPTT